MPADAMAVAVLPADSSWRSRTRALWNAYRENRGAVLGLAVVVAIVILAIGADVISPYSPTEQFRDAVRMPPVWADGGSWRSILGTDGLGRDMLSRLLHGARVSLFIGVSVMSVSFVVGISLGLLAAHFGGALDVVISRVMDLI